MRFWSTCVVCLAAGCAALGAAAPASAEETYNAEISGGYQHFAAKQEGDASSVTFKGWYADVSRNVNKMVAIVVSTAGAYNASAAGGGEHVNFRVLEFMGGVRIKAKSAKVVPFGEVLVGVAPLKGGARLQVSPGSFRTSETDVAVLGGGGVNMMGGKAGLRLAADYVHVNGKTGSVLTAGKAVTGFRFLAGVVVGVGKSTD
jgi:hypothetical protein